MTYRIVSNKAEKSAEIFIYEDIGEGWFGGMSSKQFAADLKDLGELDSLSLRLNSPGGSVFEGNTIYNLLREHSANLTVHIDGLAASIASVIAMAGDEIVMAENALMMIHDPWGFAVGTADDLRKEADVLETVRGTIITAYKSRTGNEEKEISDWMSDETWMSAQEALDRGFADSISEEMKQAASVDWRRYGYKHPPRALSAAETKAERPRKSASAPRIMRMKSKIRSLGILR